MRRKKCVYTFLYVKKGVQKQITDFLRLLDKIKDRVSKYVPRLKTVFCKRYEGDNLTRTEKIAYEFYPGYKGDIRHLFLFYDWSKVDEIEKKYADKIGDYQLRSILKTQIFMCKRRIRTYSDLIEELRENPNLAKVCELNPECIPDRKIFSRAADRTGIEVFRQIAIDMTKECLSLGLMKGRMIGVDGSLIKSNTSAHKNKEMEEYTDKYAGLYVRGNYLKGVGHLAYKLVDIEYGLPMLVQRYKGSANENPLLIEIIEDFHKGYGFYPELLSIDKGMDSEKNNKFCKEKGIGAYIQARDFGNKELIKTEKGKTFHPEYVEVTDPRVLERIANRRSECEREFSRDKWGYRRDRMSNRGEDEAELFMLITLITTLLTAITAFWVGRADLIRSTSAFKRLH
ncbi:transposase family protein [Candidatus Methanoperedens nitroreducens]|uniref:Transposase family protein n=1 Tax=Candidatus Methanoperedens nitratireducens TaxID=1392998 RepID=A0A062VEG1_9EURY|nr:transposase [Candidatus Methanoperedens nitroreducens]KCZ73585.1 transposase family protein [Candidatus Methanoperedens nitroreducens]